MLLLCFISVYSASLHKVAVFDAGSSGTRVYLYSYANSSDIYSFQSVIDKSGSTVIHKVGIPLASCYNNRTCVDTIVDSLFSYLDEHTDASERPSIPVLVYATAGMRLLPKKEQDSIIDMFYRYSSFFYSYNVTRDNIRVIEGYEEALFSWIAVNLLLDTFQDSQATVPMLEIGGASSQFAAEEARSEYKKFIYKVKIGRSEYSVFAHSWLGLGNDQATMKLNSMLTDTQKANHPCLLNGTTTDMFGTTYKGNTNVDECRVLFKKHVFTKGLKDQPCFFWQVPLPRQYDLIFTLGVPQFQSELLGIEDRAKVDHFKELSDAFSKKTSDEVHKEYPDNPYIDRALMQQIISYIFLKDGLSSDQNTVMRAPQLIDNHEPQWTLGALVSFASPGVSYKPSGLPLWFYITISAVSAAIIGMLAYLLYKNCSKAERKDYSHI